MRIKTTLRFCFTLVRMTKINKTTNFKAKTNNLSYDPAILFLGMCIKDSTSYTTDTCSTNVMLAYF